MHGAHGNPLGVFSAASCARCRKVAQDRAEENLEKADAAGATHLDRLEADFMMELSEMEATLQSSLQTDEVEEEPTPAIHERD